MRIKINASAGYQFETDYIQSALFDYLADYEYLAIGEISAHDFVDRAKALDPLFSIDDIIALAIDEGVNLDVALAMIENQAASMQRKEVIQYGPL